MAAGKNPIDPRTYVYISSNCVTYFIRDNVRESKLDWLDCKNRTKGISFQMFLVFFLCSSSTSFILYFFYLDFKKSYMTQKLSFVFSFTLAPAREKDKNADTKKRLECLRLK